MAFCTAFWTTGSVRDGRKVCGNNEALEVTERTEMFKIWKWLGKVLDLGLGIYYSFKTRDTFSNSLNTISKIYSILITMPLNSKYIFFI